MVIERFSLWQIDPFSYLQKMNIYIKKYLSNISILMVLCMVMGLFSGILTNSAKVAKAADAITQSDFIKA